MAGSDRWQVISTPEATRPATPLSGRPGEGSISARRSPTRASSRRSSRKTNRGRCGTAFHALTLVPWGCLVAVAFLVTGLVLFGIHGKDASLKSQKLFDLVDSTSEDYAKYFHKFDTYWMITIGLGTGSIVASIYLALARLDLRLRKDGRKRGRENWSPWRLSCTRAGGALALLTLLATTAWLLLNGLLLTAWGWSMLTLRDAAAPALANYNSYILQDQTVPEIAVLQTATDLVCPSKACFNLAYFSWLNTDACMCSQALIMAMQEAAAEAVGSLQWTLAGIACLFGGGLLGSVQGSADFVLLTAEWNYLRIKSKRSGSASPTRRTYTDFLQTPGSMKNATASGYNINARVGSENRKGLYNRSPTQASFMEK